MTETIEYKVLKAIQDNIPLVSEPFKTLAEGIGISEAELIDSINDLKKRRIIRQISPIYDTRMLGYDSALIAFKVKSGDIERVAEVISSHPGVSHNYERNNEFNLWFTLAVPPDSALGLDRTVKLLAQNTGVDTYTIMRTKKTFKIGVKLDAEGSNLEKEEVEMKTSKYTPLTDEEKKIIRVTQDNMPIENRPFCGYADMLSISEEKLLKSLSGLRQRGVMRRFAAILNHRDAGFKANGMVAWNASGCSTEELGLRIAAFKSVSHCYERTINGVWKHGLFSMIHGKTERDVEEVVENISHETGLKDFLILYSTREFKKKRVRYFTEELYKWEEASA
ncbi:MAG: Lrp/AsnC family transcriptional regulator [Nitrospirae bacterium]|nr:Lrp/AsnC family transcriptional regulator [Nitrospirota bacterium]